jgi:hypothetical protein
MSRDVSPQRTALTRIAGNLVFGVAPFALLAGLHPAVPAKDAAVVWICLFGTAALAGCLHLGERQMPLESASVLRRLLSCILIGSSLVAIPWHAQGLGLFPLAAVAGFVVRWWLYLLETRDLIVADRRRLALPCLATRLRRSITWITGAVIPLLILAGLPGVPLLALSFGLTAFSQWTSACELKMNELRITP